MKGDCRPFKRIGDPRSHGGTPDEARRELRDRFSQPKENEAALDIFLSSEVGCEGLDCQFCDYMVCYDLPWNPMRVGCFDRHGQQSETVAIELKAGKFRPEYAGKMNFYLNLLNDFVREPG